MSAGTLARRDIAGVTFLASNRTAAHLAWTIAELKRIHPFARLIIIQACYNAGVKASAGTHDKDGVFDVRIEGLDWWAAQLFLRRCGWAAWFRHTGDWSNPRNWHIHMCSIPEGLINTPTESDIDRAFEAAGIEVGIFVPGQIDDYFAHAIGLKGQHRAGADTSQFPRNIAGTIYRYQEDDLMAFRDWSEADKAAFGQFIQDQVRATEIEVIQPDGSRAAAHLGAIVRDIEETQDQQGKDIAAIKKKIGA